MVLAASGIYLLARSNDGSVAMAEDQKRSLVAIATQIRVLHDKLAELDRNKKTLPASEFREFFLAQRNALLAYDRETLAGMYALKVLQQEKGGYEGKPSIYDLFLALERNFSTLCSDSSLLQERSNPITKAHKQLLMDAHGFLAAIAQLDTESLQQAYQNMQHSKKFLALIGDSLPATGSETKAPRAGIAPHVEKTQVMSIVEEANQALTELRFDQLPRLIPPYSNPTDIELVRLHQAAPLLINALLARTDCTPDTVADMLYEEFACLCKGDQAQRDEAESIIANFLLDPNDEDNPNPLLGTLWALLRFGENGEALSPRAREEEIKDMLKIERDYLLLNQSLSRESDPEFQLDDDQIETRLGEREAGLRKRYDAQDKLKDVYFDISRYFYRLDEHVDYALSDADIKEGLHMRTVIPPYIRSDRR